MSLKLNKEKSYKYSSWKKNMEQTTLKRVCLLYMIVLVQRAEAPLKDPNISHHICKLLFFCLS